MDPKSIFVFSGVVKDMIRTIKGEKKEILHHWSVKKIKVYNVI